MRGSRSISRREISAAGFCQRRPETLNLTAHVTNALSAENRARGGISRSTPASGWSAAAGARARNARRG